MTDTTPTAPKSSSDQPDRPGRIQRAFDEIVERIDQKHPWYRLPKLLGLAELIGIRNTLREKNLYDTSRLPSVNPVKPPAVRGTASAPNVRRTAAGTTSTIREMGMAGTRFGRNVPLEPRPGRTGDRMLEPNPREVSRRLMTRDELIPATARQRADRRLAAVHDPRLVQARHQPDGQPVDPAAGARRRLAATAADGDAHAGRPDRAAGLGPARRRYINVDDPLVGRLADLRQRRWPSSSSCAATPAASCGCRRRCRRSRTTRRTNPTLSPGLLARAGHDADPVRPGAQRDLRPARGRAPAVRRRDAVPARPADHCGAAGQDPHRRVDAGGDRPPDRGRRRCTPTGGAWQARGCTTLFGRRQRERGRSPASPAARPSTTACRSRSPRSSSPSTGCTR